MPALLEKPALTDATRDLAGDLWRHHSRLMGLARRYFPDEAECEDIVQETFVSALRNLSRFRAESRLGTWLHRIATNQCLMRLRAQARRNVLPWSDDVPAPLAPNGQKPVWSDERREAIRESLRLLEEKHQTMIRLRYFEGFSTDQTAKLLGISTECAKMRLHRARLALRSRILARLGHEL